MKILWISNYPLPALSLKIGSRVVQNEGWKITMSKQLINSGHELSILFPYNRIINDNVDSIHYKSFLVDKEVGKRIQKINLEKHQIMKFLIGESFDMIHIWGTEFPHSYASIEAANELDKIDNVVISIQGIATECALHYFTGVDMKFIKKQALIDILQHRSLYLDAMSMRLRGIFEDKSIKKVKHIIGRTDFDRRYIRLLNPDCAYYACNETLRECFYSGKWSFENCVKHQLFMSQASYSLKGLHYVLKAIGIVRQYYPDVKLVFAGSTTLRLGKTSLIRRLLANHPYQSYLTKIIKENKLTDNIFSTGVISAKDMKNEYMRCNAYILASNIENSPNSLGEAMILGVPSIVANVGGIPSMCIDNEEALLYQHDDHFMLAARIIELFSNRDLQEYLSRKAQIRALNTHDADKNLNDLLNIYNTVSRNIS